MLTKDQALELAKSLEYKTWTDYLTLDSGHSVRAKLVPDYDTLLEDNGDWFGALYHSPRNSRSRPSECNGAARKIDTRDGAIWWQPPKDVGHDPVTLAAIEKRVRGYYREDWMYVGLVVEVRDPACECCGERKTHGASLWAIESDAGDYFAEVMVDLCSEALAE